MHFISQWTCQSLECQSFLWSSTKSLRHTQITPDHQRNIMMRWDVAKPKKYSLFIANERKCCMAIKNLPTMCLDVFPKPVFVETLSSRNVYSKGDSLHKQKSFFFFHMSKQLFKVHQRLNDHEGTRTLNLLIRSQTPYPLGHAVCLFGILQGFSPDIG